MCGLGAGRTRRGDASAPPGTAAPTSSPSAITDRPAKAVTLIGTSLPRRRPEAIVSACRKPLGLSMPAGGSRRAKARRGAASGDELLHLDDVDVMAADARVSL